MTEQQLPSVLSASALVVQEMSRLLDTQRLFGRERQMEEVFKAIDLAHMRPCTLLLSGPPESYPFRFLHALAGFFSGQHLPVAQVICHPARQAIPNGLVIALITGFLAAHAPERLELIIGPRVRQHPWLAWYFPVLRHLTQSTQLPPDDPQNIHYVLEALLLTIVRERPHLAIVHHMHHADADSLETLRTLQQFRRQGLRLLASVDLEAQDCAANWAEFLATTPEPMLLQPLTTVALRGYLESIDPELVQPELVERLYTFSSGQPMLVEVLLRAFVLNGLLVQQEGKWVFTPTEAPDGDQSASGAPAGELPADDFLPRTLDLLGQAALVGSTSPFFLRMLWHLSEEETLDMVERGRLLGFFAPVDPNDPERVDFVDPDHRAYLARCLRPEQQEETRAAISQLLEQTTTHQQASDARFAGHTRAQYLLDGIGIEQEMALFLAETQHEARGALPEKELLQNLPWVEELTWNIIPLQDVDDSVMRLIIEAVLAVRLAGVNYRLYPLHCAPVIESTDKAITALGRLLEHRQSLTITYDTQSLAFDGRTLQQVEIQSACRTFKQWMDTGCLQAIGFARGVARSELERFLIALATHEPLEGFVALLSKIASLNLTHIKVFSCYFMPALPSTTDGGEDGQLTNSHQSILAYLDKGLDALPAYGEMNETPPLPSVTQVQTGLIPLVDIHGKSPENSFLISQGDWQALESRLDTSPPSIRSVLVANLAQWVRDHEFDEENVGQVDDVVIHQMQREDDLEVIPDLIQLVERRITAVFECGNWEKIESYLRVICHRYAVDNNVQIHHLLSELLTRICAGAAYGKWLDTEELDAATGVKRLQNMNGLLGEFAAHPLLARLQQQESVKENERLMRLWSMLSLKQREALVTNLRRELPWYYTRNLLQVLGEFGSHDVLGSISDKCMHAHPLVRAAAIEAAGKIAGPQAIPYIVRGLEDRDPDVCCAAAMLAARYPHPRLLPLLLAVLTHPRFSVIKGEHAQWAACTALTHYPGPETSAVLLRIANPPWLILGNKPTITLRCIALATLAQINSDDPKVGEAINRARAERNPELRNAAEQATAIIAQKQG